LLNSLILQLTWYKYKAYRDARQSVSGVSFESLPSLKMNENAAHTSLSACCAEFNAVYSAIRLDQDEYADYTCICIFQG
jgi:hypothetical protein